MSVQAPTTLPHLYARVTSLVALVFVALASGTPYLYAVYAPQLVLRIGLTASDSATIALAENLGSGFGGLPAGLFIDAFGPLMSILLGSFAIFSGYLGVHEVYQHQYSSLVLTSAFMILLGFGSIISFFATLKAAQANFPKNRGLAGAFPVSTFGLLATLFSVIAATFYGDNTGGLLLFLAIFCGSVNFIACWFIHVYLEHEDETELAYSRVEQAPSDEEAAVSDSAKVLSPTPLKKQPSLAGSLSFWGIGDRSRRNSEASSITETPNALRPLREQDKLHHSASVLDIRNEMFGARENGSFSNRTPTLSGQATPLLRTQSASSVVASAPPIPKTVAAKTPFAVVLDLLKNKIFLIHFTVVSLTSGMCQMYIFSVGFVVTAQFNYNRDLSHFLMAAVRTVTSNEMVISKAGTAAALQALQVSIISIASFSGRFLSGFISDFIYKRLQIQRLWIVAVTTMVLACGELLLIKNKSNIHLILISSAIIGSCYGLAFGTYPAIIADIFGTKTFSTTWGLICTGPLITLFVLNKYFGAIYDYNTDEETGICFKANDCYKGAFELSLGLCFVALFVALSLIYIQRKKR